MKIRPISILLATIGTIIGFSSYYRWFIKYQDFSNAIFGLSFGIGIVTIAYIYNWMRNIDEDLEKMRLQYQALISMWTKNESDDMKALAKGEELR
jgi:hypothetical protein